MREKPHHRGHAYWSTLVAEFESAPCPHADFCRPRGLNIGTFRFWLYKLRDEAEEAKSSPGFVELVVGGRQSTKSSTCSLVVGKVELRFEALPSPEYLAELLRNVAR